MKTRKKVNLLYLTPLMILMVFQPLILRLYEFDNGLSEYAWMGETSGSSMDLFLHSKMVFFECICMACMIVSIQKRTGYTAIKNLFFIIWICCARFRFYPPVQLSRVWFFGNLWTIWKRLVYSWIYIDYSIHQFIDTWF